MICIISCMVMCFLLVKLTLHHAFRPTAREPGAVLSGRLMQRAEASRVTAQVCLSSRKCVLLEATDLQFCCHSFQMAPAVFL